MPNRVLDAGRVLLSRSITAEVRAAVAAACANAQPRLTVLQHPSEAALPAGLPESTPPASTYLQMWQRELGREFDPFDMEGPQRRQAAFQCLITADHADADAAYALYTRRVPVLLLRGGIGAPEFAAQEGHPLLTVASEATTAGAAADAVGRFLTFPEAEGRVFVVEGGDGAGKQTQVARLVARLVQEGFPVRSIDYPHDAAKFGLLIREVLGGQRGNMRDVSPLVFAAVYGVNREDHQPVLAYWKLKGVNVVLDRYMTANFGHQASKYSSDEERKAAIAALATFEQRWLDLPKPDRVTYLNLPPSLALAAMQTDGTRKALDEHEKAGIEYKNNVRRAFLWCCENLDGWAEVPCANPSEEQRLTRDEVHEAVWANFSPLFVNKGLGVSLLR
jgi:dTMP kinase